ncbi:MAG: DUF5683 domain-containing protein [Bacteroidota bacterium]
MGKTILKILFISLAISSTIFCQEELDTVKTVQSDDSTFVMIKSPWGAVGRSAILPGWGQCYNESYWKIPIFWGVLGWFSYLYIDNNNYYKQYRDLYSESLQTSPSGNSNYKEARNFYRNQRDQWALFIGLVYFLNLVDAYVDAHLFDFNVTENKYYQSPQVNMKYYFNR